MRVSGGESVCPPPDPAQTQRAERWEVPYTVGGWMGVEDAVLQSHLVLGKKGANMPSRPRPRVRCPKPLATPPRISTGLLYTPRLAALG